AGAGVGAAVFVLAIAVAVIAVIGRPRRCLDAQQLIDKLDGGGDALIVGPPEAGAGVAEEFEPDQRGRAGRPVDPVADIDETEAAVVRPDRPEADVVAWEMVAGAVFALGCVGPRFDPLVPTVGEAEEIVALVGLEEI